MSGVLNNRWNMSDKLDQNFYTTRTITGRLRVNRATLDPQAFRAWVIPPLQQGFIREAIECTTSVDGLTLDYNVTDREMFVAPPGEATDWDGTHTRITGDGSQTHDELALTLQGPKDADKANLMALAATIIEQKCSIGDPGVVLEQASVVDFLNENKVEIRARVTRTNVDPMRVFNLPRGNFGKPLTIDGYDKDAARVPATFGTATAAGLFVCYLQSPCNDAHSINLAEGEPTTNVTIELSPNTNTYEYTGEIPTDEEVAGNYNIEELSNVYTHYEMTSTYVTQNNAIQLPLAAASDTTEDTSVIVRLAPPTTRRRVHVLAQRAGAWPLLPKASEITFGGQPTFLIGREHKQPRTPKLMPDGKTKLYEIEYSFVVATKRPVTDDSTLEVGHLPWDSSDVATLPPDTFIEGLA
jgi:hypothetical protein